MKKIRKSTKTTKNIKDIKNPILRNCTYIIVPVVALVAFKFLGTGVNWLLGIISQAGWPILITFVLTSLFWACFYGVREQKKADVAEEPVEEDEEDEYEEF